MKLLILGFVGVHVSIDYVKLHITAM